MEKEKLQAEEIKLDEKELEEAERLAMEAENLYEYIHTLKNPFEYEGRTHKTLHFDWGMLTGNDGLAVENEMQALGIPVVVPALSGGYLIRIAARACTDGVGADVLLAMPIREYNKIRSEARSFLLKTEL